jgi:hypothetical protein
MLCRRLRCRVTTHGSEKGSVVRSDSGMRGVRLWNVEVVGATEKEHDLEWMRKRDIPYSHSHF